MTRPALFAGAALALALSAPAVAQEAMTPTAPAQAQTQQTLTLQPGANVLGADGSTLGTLEGVRTDASGEQQLTVRGADGQTRGVPVTGIAQQGADISVGWSAAEFGAAEVISEGDPGVDGWTPPADDGTLTPNTDGTMAPSDGISAPGTPVLPTDPVGQPDVDDAMDNPTAPPQDLNPSEPSPLATPED